MAFDKLPRPILRDILDQIILDESSTISEILALRLVNRCLDAEIVRSIYDRDSFNIHSRLDGIVKPTGVALQRIVKGFILRSNDVPDVLKELVRSLRDGVLIMTALLECTSETDHSETLPTVRISGSATATATATATIPSHGKKSNVWVRSQISEDPDGDEDLPDAASFPVCKAYVDLLEEDRAFESLNVTWDRDPDKWRKLDDKTPHFWALLAAVCDGREDVVNAAIKACIDKLANEENTTQLKMYLAAALQVAAKQGKTEIAETIIAQPAMKVNLRLQNTRFASKNAMEVAIEKTHGDVVHLLLRHGWNLSADIADLMRSLKATVTSMEISPLRDELLQLMLEGDCQEWKSPSVLAGLFVELCKRGDLKTCQKLLVLLERPDKPWYEWSWTAPDDLNNDYIMSAPAPVDNGEDDFFNFNHTHTNDEDTAVYKAVTGKHNHMIPFLFDSYSLFPESMNQSFTLSCILKCLEHTILNKEQDAFRTLLDRQSKIDLKSAYLGSDSPKVCLRKIILFAVCHGNLPAVEVLLPYVDLNSLIKLNDGFCDTSYDGSVLNEMTCLLEDTDNPNAFLNMRYYNQPDNIKLGTFLLVTAIKFLHIEITKLLLSKSCTIGYPLRIFSRSMIEIHHARLWLPHESSACGDCTSTLPLLTNPHPPTTDPTPKDNYTLTLITTSSLPPWSIKRMVENGTPLSDCSTPRIITPATRWRFWRWKELGEALVKMDAKIISAIQIPSDIWNRGEKADMEERLEEMRTLVREWGLPDLYTNGQGRSPPRRRRRRRRIAYN